MSNHNESLSFDMDYFAGRKAFQTERAKAPPDQGSTPEKGLDLSAHSEQVIQPGLGKFFHDDFPLANVVKMTIESRAPAYKKPTSSDFRFKIDARTRAIFFPALILLSCVITLNIMIGHSSNWQQVKGGILGTKLTTDHLGVPAMSDFSAMVSSRQHVDTVCTKEKIENDKDRKVCEKVCENYLGCCDIFDNNLYANDSETSKCEYEENLEYCYNHAKCHGLKTVMNDGGEENTSSNSDTIFSPAPRNIEHLCNPSNIAINRKECEDICHPLRCCYDDSMESPSCLAIHYNVCQDYSLCQNLRRENTNTAETARNFIDVAPTDLGTKCRIGSPSCIKHCNRAENCCTDTNSDCFRHNFIACLSYVACNEIYSADNNEVMGATTATDKISTFRSKNKVIGISSTHSPPSSSHLYKLPIPPDNLYQMCLPNSLRLNPSNCDIACEPSDCCWEHNGINNNCFDQDPIGCISYSACNVLDLEDTLFNNNPNVAGTSTQKIAATTSTAINDATENNQIINRVKGVDSITGTSTVPLKRVDDTNVTNLLQPQFTKSKTQIENRCGRHNIDYTSRRQECVNHCQPTSNGCCNPYTSDDNKKCYMDNIVGCNNYARCHVLDDRFPPAPDEIKIHCTAHAIANNGKFECEKWCEAARCCYDHDNTAISSTKSSSTESCITTNYEVCQDYAMCFNLRDDTIGDNNKDSIGSIIPVANDGLSTHCKDRNGQICKDQCETSTLECCSDSFSDCFRDNFFACLSYMVCPGSIDNEDMPLLPEEEKQMGSRLQRPNEEKLLSVCKLSYFAATGQKECRDMCSDANCCFESGHANCFGLDPLRCLEYLPCNIIFKNDNRFPLLKQTIEDKFCPMDDNDDHESLSCQDKCQVFYQSSFCDPYYDQKKKENDSQEYEQQPQSNFYKEVAGCYSYSRCILSSHSPLGNDHPELIVRETHPIVDGLTLQDSCSIDQLLKNRTRCENLCTGIASCCWDYEQKSAPVNTNNDAPKLSCLSSNFALCLEFAPCFNLRQFVTNSDRQKTIILPELYDDSNITFIKSPNNGIRMFDDDDDDHNDISSIVVVLPVAPRDLDLLCKDDFNNCFELCSVADSCCNDDTSECYRYNFVSCISYATCNSKLGYMTSFYDLPKAFNLLPPMMMVEVNSSSLLNETYNDGTTKLAVCENDYIQNFGDKLCINSCKAANCCWSKEHNDNSYCFGDDPFGCLEYLHCETFL